MLVSTPRTQPDERVVPLIERVGKWRLDGRRTASELNAWWTGRRPALRARPANPTR